MNAVIHCPWHKERTPSLMVRNDKFHCFGCGLSGRAERHNAQCFRLTPDDGQPAKFAAVS